MTGCLHRGWMEGCYQLLKDSRRHGRRRRTALRSPLTDIQQTVAFCSHCQQGCCHWVMLADTQASYAAVSTAARLQLLLCACLPLHVRSSVHTCVCHSHVFFVCTKSTLYTIQRLVSSALRQSPCKATALFSSPSCHVNSQPVSR